MRAAKTKIGSSKPANGIKRSCQERAQSDVVTPKAMKDPNWRTRQDTSSSTDAENMIPSVNQPNSKAYPQAASSNSSHSSNLDQGSSDFSIVDAFSSEASSASGGFVKIIKKIDLTPIDGRKMSIFQLDLRPETPTPCITNSDRRYAKVSRNASSHQRDSSSATEATASSQGTDNMQTPDVSEIVTLNRLCRESSSGISSHDLLNELHEVYERDKDVGISFEQSVPFARDRTPVDGPLQSPQTAIRNSRDQAFQRLIQKLNHDNQSSKSQASQSPTTRQVSQRPPEPELANKLPINKLPTNKLPVNLRRPMGGGGRRNQTISDFKVDYWEHSQSSETSGEGSQATVQNASSQSTWNPKAREFFSIGHQQNPRRAPLWNTGLPLSQGKVSSNLDTMPCTGAAWSKVTQPPLNPYKPSGNQDALPNSTFKPPAASPFTPAYNLGLGPETFNPAHYFPGGSAPQPPFFTVPPLPATQAPIMPFGNFSAQQIAAQQVAAQQIAALPYLASLASLGPLPPLLTALEKPNSTANIRRPVVPKPTLPNASAQLAYEEWIEWRKANEPGYAVECKARQQRRSQRIKGPKEGGGEKPAESRIAPARAVAAA